ncbi:MAG TPA: hypothetical protein VFB32_16555 [Rudaea sp.]|nr:hypothetical protein [Rudaea sp.]
MGRRHLASMALWAVAVFGCTTAHATITVTAPPAGSTTVAAGDDYATQVIGDAWDMSNPQDIDTDESAQFNAQSFSGGLFTATYATTGCNSGFYPLFMGYGTQTVAIARGPLYPVDTSHYRYFTAKFKATGTNASLNNILFFFQDGDSRVNNTYGASTFKSANGNQWEILTWDLDTEFSTGTPYKPWTSLPHVQGIEFVPCNSATGGGLQVDWIRLTAAPSAAQMYTVMWSDTGGNTSYTISAADADGATYIFTNSASGTSYSADLSRLAPGDYHITVAGNTSGTATSAGVLHVNAPPQVAVTAPSQRGEQSLSYAVQQQGGQWAVPMSAADFKTLVNFKSVGGSYFTNATCGSGSFCGVPTNADPEFIMNTTGHTIDASYYRSACFTLEVYAPRNVGTGSIARLLWGVSASAVSTTTDIVLGTGLVEYCMPDLADSTAVPLVSGSPQPWAGNLGYFRMDPDEITPAAVCSNASPPQSCFVRLDSVILSPFASANPGYTFKWTFSDAESASANVDIYLDPDKIPGNGNEVLIGTTTASSGNNQFVWGGSGSVNYGKYYALLVTDDGTNSVSQYSGGPIIVGPSDGIFRNGFD